MSGASGRNRSRTPLSKIRRALDIAAAQGNYAAAKAEGVNCTTIRHWQLRQMREHTGWPTPADIAEWERDDAENAARRAVNAARVDGYRRRTYLNQEPLWVDATGTRRRLQALCALGWTQLDIGGRLTSTDNQWVSILCRDKRPRILITTRDEVTALYDALSMRVPTHRPQWVIDRQRRDSARKGWALPLEWDDHALDDPTAPTPRSALRRRDAILAASTTPRHNQTASTRDEDAA